MEGHAGVLKHTKRREMRRWIIGAAWLEMQKRFDLDRTPLNNTTVPVTAQSFAPA
ncbi:hypothetical protein [Burkholderia territorii]|uniref:hypothetical protein n=1 Tax=Burkholderia territorii TaxID=1503055 RepID=UPI0012DB2FBE|nr:hypothetical protein [Burkholderia territorii]